MTQREEVVLHFEDNNGRSNNKEEKFASKGVVNSPSDKIHQDLQEKRKGSESTKKRKQDQQRNQESHLQTSHSEENVARSTSNSSTPQNSWKSSISRIKSRLIDPPEESCANSESSELLEILFFNCLLFCFNC